MIHGHTLSPLCSWLMSLLIKGTFFFLRTRLVLRFLWPLSPILISLYPLLVVSFKRTKKTLKRTLMKRNEKGGSLQNPTLILSLVFTLLLFFCLVSLLRKNKNKGYKKRYVLVSFISAQQGIHEATLTGLGTFKRCDPQKKRGSLVWYPFFVKQGI